MRNELILIISLLTEYSLVVLAYKHFGKTGIFVWIAVASVLANIEVMILVNAFGLEMTLGNILFATTFLSTDILSENHGESDARKAVIIGIAADVFFVLLTLSWMIYIPSENDVSSENIRAIFGSTPRIVISSLAVFSIVQFLDVFLYHRIWNFFRRNNPKEKYLWVRNNAATIISQTINAILYNVLAFYGVYPKQTIVNIILSTMVIFVVTSLADTPFLYWARLLKRDN